MKKELLKKLIKGLMVESIKRGLPDVKIVNVVHVIVISKGQYMQSEKARRF